MRPQITFLDLVTLIFDLWPWPSGSTLGASTTIPWPNFMTLGAILFEIWILNKASNHVFWPGDLDIWPMTLTFRVKFGVIYVHALTKFHSPRCNTFRDMNFGKVFLVKSQTKSDAYEPTVHKHRWAQKTRCWIHLGGGSYYSFLQTYRLPLCFWQYGIISHTILVLK